MSRSRETLPPKRKSLEESRGGPAGFSFPEGLEKCRGLVRSIAWKIHQKLPPYIELDELVAWGELGLAEAAQRYRPDRGAKFNTFAYHRIRGSIFDGLSKMRFFSVRDFHASKYEEMSNELLALEAEDGVEFAPKTTDEQIQSLKEHSGALAVVYLATVGGREESDVIDSNAGRSDELAIEKELRGKLEQLIERLPSDAGFLVRAVYFEGKNLRAAATELGISRAWACRLHAKTLQRLAHGLRLMGLEA